MTPLGRVGNLVRLKENKLFMAIIESRIKDQPGSVILDREIAGFRYWHMDDLEYVPRTSPLRRYFNQEEALMTPQTKAKITQQAQKLVYAMCNKYTGTRPEKYCQGCRLARSVFNRDYAAMNKALKAKRSKKAA